MVLMYYIIYYYFPYNKTNLLFLIILFYYIPFLFLTSKFNYVSLAGRHTGLPLQTLPYQHAGEQSSPLRLGMSCAVLSKNRKSACRHARLKIKCRIAGVPICGRAKLAPTIALFECRGDLRSPAFKGLGTGFFVPS